MRCACLSWGVGGLAVMHPRVRQRAVLHGVRIQKIKDTESDSV